jgi:integrase
LPIEGASPYSVTFSRIDVQTTDFTAVYYGSIQPLSTVDNRAKVGIYSCTLTYDPARYTKRITMSRKFDIDAFVRNKDGGRHRKFFGHGLCLTVQGNSARWERFWRDPITKKIKSAPVGPYKGIDGLGLSEARRKREEDAVGTRNGRGHNGAGIVTGKLFGEVVDEFIEFKSNLAHGAWRGGAKGEEADAYRRTLKAVWPASVATLDTAAIGDVLTNMKPVTAKKTRVRIKAVLDWAKAKGYRSGDNPAAKEMLTPRMPSIPRAKHFAALPLTDLPAFMKELAAIDTPVSRALRFTILTGARTEQTLGATWKEIVKAGTIVPTADGSTTHALAGDQWIIPASRMKEEGNREHRVPLIPETLAILSERGDAGDNNPLFGPIHDRQMLWLMRSLRPDLRPKPTVHGTTRNCLTDWIIKQNCYLKPLRKTALAQAPGDDAVDKAYARDELCEERRPMMQAYANFATGS